MGKYVVMAVLVLAVGATASAQPRAYRNIDFGDSPVAVAQKVVADNAFGGLFKQDIAKEIAKDPASAQGSMQASDIYTTIGGERYYVNFNFYDGKLFRVRIVSNAKNADYFDTEEKRLRDNLVTVITQAYGKPGWHHDLSFLDMQTNRIAWSDIWYTNSDGVAYKIGLGEYESEYYAGLWVEWTKLREQYDAAQQQQQNKQQQKSAKDF